MTQKPPTLETLYATTTQALAHRIENVDWLNRGWHSTAQPHQWERARTIREVRIVPAIMRMTARLFDDQGEPTARTRSLGITRGTLHQEVVRRESQTMRHRSRFQGPPADVDPDELLVRRFELSARTVGHEITIPAYCENVPDAPHLLGVAYPAQVPIDYHASRHHPTDEIAEHYLDVYDRANNERWYSHGPVRGPEPLERLNRHVQALFPLAIET